MTDDADLRARIEAQVAARRAAKESATAHDRAPWDVDQVDEAPELEPGPASYVPDPAVYEPYDPTEAEGPRRRFARRGVNGERRRPRPADAAPSEPPVVDAAPPPIAPPPIAPLPVAESTPVAASYVPDPAVYSPVAEDEDVTAVDTTAVDTTAVDSTAADETLDDSIRSDLAAPPTEAPPVTRDVAASVAEVAPPSDEPDYVEPSVEVSVDTSVEPAKKRGRLGRAARWVFAWEKGQDEPGTPEPSAPVLDLPEPDPAFDVPWSRHHANAAPASPAASAAVTPAPAATTPGRKPSVRPRPGGVVPDADPSRPRPRPTAPPSAASRPAASIAAAPAPPSGVSRAAHPVTKAPPPASEPAKAAVIPRPGPGPDLSRFLDASETKPGDEVDEEAQKAKLARPRGGNSKIVRGLLRYAIIIGVAVLATLALRRWVVEPYYIPSASMEPTLHGCKGCTDDRILVDKISYRFHDPQPGDIIVFNRPPGVGVTEPQLVKRVVGVPGDTITLRGGKVIVNGKVLNEDYLDAKFVARCGGTNKTTSVSTWKIPSDRLFVMGDNRCDSYDSRFFGPIKESSVIGRAFLIFYPLSRFGGP